MAVHDNKAYLFRGRPALDYFDLVNERWDQLQTSFNHANGRPAPWPHQDQSLSDFAMHIVRGRMYVFGGTPHESKLGCNYFAVLDLVTRRWEHLSGTVSHPVPDDSCPGPRKYTARCPKRTNLCSAGYDRQSGVEDVPSATCGTGLA
ncbi:hypothetical protein AcW1_009340 [Taiwanofungus camphoratus]|nr:hypothetical protein AcW1_009340 [Antrodia cinnamomea]